MLPTRSFRNEPSSKLLQVHPFNALPISSTRDLSRPSRVPEIQGDENKILRTTAATIPSLDQTHLNILLLALSRPSRVSEIINLTADRDRGINGVQFEDLRAAI
ncbi:hypothetical protein Drorol1_Dr00010850 [Drosera rotundifolia]